MINFNKRFIPYIILFNLIFFLLVSSYGQTTEDHSYLAGIENCKAIQHAKQKEKPDQLFFGGPECMIGYQLPDFQLTTIEGREISNQSLKGKFTVINFWFLA